MNNMNMLGIILLRSRFLGAIRRCHWIINLLELGQGRPVFRRAHNIPVVAFSERLYQILIEILGRHMFTFFTPGVSTISGVVPCSLTIIKANVLRTQVTCALIANGLISGAAYEAAVNARVAWGWTWGEGWIAEPGSGESLSLLSRCGSWMFWPLRLWYFLWRSRICNGPFRRSILARTRGWIGVTLRRLRSSMASTNRTRAGLGPLRLPDLVRQYKSIWILPCLQFGRWFDLPHHWLQLCIGVGHCPFEALGARHLWLAASPLASCRFGHFCDGVIEPALPFELFILLSVLFASQCGTILRSLETVWRIYII